MKIITYLLTIFFPIFSFSQYIIQGQVSNNYKSLDYTTISLLNKNQEISVTISDSLGAYKLNVPNQGNYQIRYSRIGFLAKDTFLFINKNLAINVLLQQEVNILEEVKIKTFLPEIKRKANGYYFDIENTYLAKGNTMNSILTLLPGVISNGDGKISLANNNVLLMIDNQEIKLPAPQLTAYLNNIRSENVKHIEVITSPTAEYDAEGIGGIIKIITKNKIQNSYEGSVSGKYMQGVYPKNDISANFMTNHNKIFQYCGISTSFNDKFGYMENFRENINLNSQQNNLINVKSRDITYGLNAGLKYNINSKNFLNFDFAYSTSKTDIRNGHSYMQTQIIKEHMLDTIITSYIPAKSFYKTLSLSLNFQRKTDSLGSDIRFTTDYLLPKAHSYNGFYNAYYLASNSQFIDSVINDNNINVSYGIYSFRFDRSKFFVNKKSKISYGLKFVDAKTGVDNNYRIYEEKWFADQNLTNSLKYQENILANYINFESKLNNVDLIAGVRSEYTSYKVLSNDSYYNKYFKIFPNLSILVPINNSNSTTLGFHYNKRIERPGYEILNPFTYKMDQYSLKQGNPYLKPSISNSITLDFNFKKTYSTSFTYTKINNSYGDVQKPLGELTIQTFDNLKNTDQIAINISGYKNISKIWTTLFQASFFNRKIISTGYTANNLGAILTSINMIKISPTFDVRATMQFITKGTDRFTKINKSIFNSTLDFNKTFTKLPMQIKFGVNDLFNTWGKMSLTYDYLGLRNTINLQKESRYFYLTLVYVFHKGKSLQRSEYEKSNIDEEKRVK